MRLSLRGALCALGLSLLAACGGSDHGSFVPLPGGGEPPPASTQATVSGTVHTGTDQTPVAGVTVTLAGQHATTDEQGRYSLSVDNPGDSGVVQARRNGFLGMAKQAPLHAGSSTTQDITLYPVDVQTTFPASRGAIVVANGAVIDIPAGAIQDASGAPFDGTVHIDAGYRGPTTAEGIDAFPQPYAAIDDDGADVTMQTLGVIEARLYDDAGQPLQLRKKALLTYPSISAIDQGATSIPLAYYDEERAIWVREGEALRLSDDEGGGYQGSVSHFTKWNVGGLFGERYRNVGSVSGCIHFADGAASRFGVGVTLTSSKEGIFRSPPVGESRALDSQPLKAGPFTLVNVPLGLPLTLRFDDSGTGKNQSFFFIVLSRTEPHRISVPWSPSSPCVELVGTTEYALPPAPPPLEPVAADTPPSLFAGVYPIFFTSLAQFPSDTGSKNIAVDRTGKIFGSDLPDGLTTVVVGDEVQEWHLGVSGRVFSGGYITMTMWPTAPINPLHSHPNGAMLFTGRFLCETPSCIDPVPRGTWTYTQPNRLVDWSWFGTGAPE